MGLHQRNAQLHTQQIAQAIDLYVGWRRSDPSPLRGGWRAKRAGWGKARSPLHLPGRCAVLIVLEGDAHSGEFVADAIGLGPVF